MLVSASRRTDIPRWFHEWFMNRIRAGYALTRNPMNHSQLSRIPLTPDIVDCIIFWTKDPAPLLPSLAELDRRGFMYYFQFTLTPYDRGLEPNLRTKEDIAATFAGLSDRIGRERVVWRYDPIILNDTLTMNWHKERFAALCSKLAPYTDTVTISFVDLYPKLRSGLLRPISETEIAELSGYIAETAEKFGIRAVACCESGLEKYGISGASCIDRRRIERICGCTLYIGADKNQRPGCGCCASVDIGAYNTCLNGCIYCYANHSPGSVSRRFASHDPHSELLIGSVSEGERIVERPYKSDKCAQMSFQF